MDYCDDVAQWRKRGYKQKIIPMRVSEKVEGFTMAKKKIFIGSSKESIEDMAIIAALIDSMEAEARPWNSVTNPVFIAGNYTLDSLLEVAEKVDGAIFMFNAEDVTWYTERMKEENTVRDNVLLEYGLFCGKKGRKNVAFVCKNKKRVKEIFALYLRFIPSNCKAGLVVRFWKRNVHKLKYGIIKQISAEDVVISASPMFIVGVAVKAIGVQNCIATNMSIESGKIVGENCYGKVKLEKFYLNYPNIKLNAFYSDSLSDLPMKEVATNFYLVKGEVAKRYEGD